MIILTACSLATKQWAVIQAKISLVSGVQSGCITYLISDAFHSLSLNLQYHPGSSPSPPPPRPHLVPYTTGLPYRHHSPVNKPFCLCLRVPYRIPHRRGSHKDLGTVLRLYFAVFPCCQLLLLSDKLLRSHHLTSDDDFGFTATFFPSNPAMCLPSPARFNTFRTGPILGSSIFFLAARP